MIRKLARLLFTLAIALAVPAQGVAAVSAGMCMALGHHEASAEVAQAAEHAHHSEPAASGEHSHAAGNDANCAPCVSCCAAASISTAQVVLAQLPPDRSVEAAGASTPREFYPGQLDRPPLALPA